MLWMQGLGKLLAFFWQLMYRLLLPYDTGDFHSQVFKVQLEFLPTRLRKANTLNLNPKLREKEPYLQELEECILWV
jgi:hypothetical protein